MRISRKLYFPADEVSRKRNFPTIPQTSTLLFRRSAFYSCLQYITAPLSVHISRSFRINSAFSVIYTSQPPFFGPLFASPFRRVLTFSPFYFRLFSLQAFEEPTRPLGSRFWESGHGGQCYGPGVVDGFGRVSPG